MSKKRFPSKIIAPVYQSVFERQRLLALFSENQHRPLVWVNGSAGMGKTTVVNSWLQQQQDPFLWYRMDSGHNGSADLFYFLSLSAQRNYPNKKLKLPVFTVEYADDVKAFAVIFFRQLFAVLETEVAIIFDNCQEIENDPDFFHVLQIALNDIPEGLQIICISRNRPANFFSRLSLSGDLLDINPAQLLFTDSESGAFLKWLNPKLDYQSSNFIQQQAKGWAVALVLLAQRQADKPPQAANIQQHQDIFNFLMMETLAHLDETALQFLTKTAIFNQFTTTMAISLTDYQNAQIFLDELFNKNFLIDKTNQTFPVYCYHPILRDLLIKQNKKNSTQAQLKQLSHKAISILLAQENIEEAIPFYLQLQDWDELTVLLTLHSESFINKGRHSLLISWIEQLPDKILINNAWLMYWYAGALKPFNPNRAIELLDQCYLTFLQSNDILGLYSSWQVAVDAIFISLDDFTSLKLWFQRFDELREHHPKCPSFEVNIKFSATAIQTLPFYNQQHPWLSKLLKLSEFGFRFIPVKLVKHIISAQLGNYYALTFDIAKYQLIKPFLIANIDDENQPILLRISNLHSIAYFYVNEGDAKNGLLYFEKGLEVSKQFATPLLVPLLQLNQAGGYICHGDIESAEKTLDSISFTNLSERRLLIAFLYFSRGWIHAIKGNRVLALEQNEQSLLTCQQISNNFGTLSCLGLKAQLLAEDGQWELAELTLSLLADIRSQTPNILNQFLYNLCDAWFGFLLNDQSRVLAAIEKFLSIVKQEQIKFFLGWQPKVISSLCVLAIEHNIEVDFAISLMQLNSLCPPPPYIEQWPWPVRIYCFKPLQIELNGNLLRQSGKSQKRVIELLCTIIALGSQHVSIAQVCDCLWPDSDGDLAKQTMDTAIFRLRKLIGKSAVRVKEGTISLDTEHCWIDILAFEATLLELDETLFHHANENLLTTLTKRLFHLYPSPFLREIDSDFVKVKRQQLENKLARQIERLIIYYAEQKNDQHISYLLEQCLERIPQFSLDDQTIRQKNLIT